MELYDEDELVPERSLIAPMRDHDAEAAPAKIE